ncbi:hypothetical protein GW17_00057905 [Ensete ventricosum]|nr:hypothetical protein GW17_00057905 [Ensete ventricosum]
MQAPFDAGSYNRAPCPLNIPPQRPAGQMREAPTSELHLHPTPRDLGLAERVLGLQLEPSQANQTVAM